MRCTELTLIARDLAMAAAAQCVTSPGGSVSVSATTRFVTASASDGMRDGRVLSTSNPSVPAGVSKTWGSLLAGLGLIGLADA